MSYIITGGAGFIGSVLIGYLNQQGITDIIIIDHLGDTEKWKNLLNKKFLNYFDKSVYLKIVQNEGYICEDDIVIHLGACSDTTQTDCDYLMQNNFKYSQSLYKQCESVGAKFIYASSAATYGDGSAGYSDDNFDLQPLNMYGYTKHLFDQRIMQHTNNLKECDSQVVGLKFFNVYGPNEYHKGKMASVVYHGFNQIQAEGKIGLFKSYKKGYADGEQKRDFIYVKDVVKVIDFFIKKPKKSGIFNLGTGKARTFNDLTRATFKALNIKPNIKYKDMPDTLKDKYQYFTQAEMEKLQKAGYKGCFFSLEEGIADYVQNYLNKGHKTF